MLVLSHLHCFTQWHTVEGGWVVRSQMQVLLTKPCLWPVGGSRSSCPPNYILQFSAHSDLWPPAGCSPWRRTWWRCRRRPPAGSCSGWRWPQEARTWGYWGRAAGWRAAGSCTSRPPSCPCSPSLPSLTHVHTQNLTVRLVQTKQKPWPHLIIHDPNLSYCGTWLLIIFSYLAHCL